MGYLTEKAFVDELQRMTAGMERTPGRVAVLFDLRQMTGYEAPVRSRYVQWHGEHRDRLARVAVVTDNSLWRVVVSTIGLAVRAMVRTFEEPGSARRWCESGARY